MRNWMRQKGREMSKWTSFELIQRSMLQTVPAATGAGAAADADVQCTPSTSQSTSTFIIFNCKQTLWQQQANFLLLFQQNGISLKSKCSRCIAHMTHTHSVTHFYSIHARTHLRSHNRMSKSFWFRMARSLQSLVLSSYLSPYSYLPPSLFVSLPISINFSMQMYGQIYVFRISKTWVHSTHLLMWMECECTLEYDVSIWTTSKHFALFLFSYRTDRICIKHWKHSNIIRQNTQRLRQY